MEELIFEVAAKIQLLIFLQKMSITNIFQRVWNVFLRLSGTGLIKNSLIWLLLKRCRGYPAGLKYCSVPQDQILRNQNLKVYSFY